MNFFYNQVSYFNILIYTIDTTTTTTTTTTTKPIARILVPRVQKHGPIININDINIKINGVGADVDVNKSAKPTYARHYFVKK